MIHVSIILSSHGIAPANLNYRAIPMQKKLVFARIPYEVFEVTCLIELSTNTKTAVDPTDKSKKIAYQVRPDIFLSSRDERELFIVREREELNQTDSFTMITEAPNVVTTYDAKKKYTPKYGELL